MKRLTQEVRNRELAKELFPELGLRLHDNILEAHEPIPIGRQNTAHRRDTDRGAKADMEEENTRHAVSIASGS